MLPSRTVAEPMSGSRRRAQPNLTPYSRLIEDAIQREGYTSLAEVARASGIDPATGKQRLSRQRVQQIVNLPISRPPEDVTIEGLARALHLSEEVIRTHVAETLGLRSIWSPRGELRELVEMVRKLPEADQERWARLARMLVREFQQYPVGPRRSEQAGFTVDREKADGMEMFLAKIEGTPDLSDDQRSELLEFGKKIMGEAAG